MKCMKEMKWVNPKPSLFLICRVIEQILSFYYIFFYDVVFSYCKWLIMGKLWI